MGHCSLIVKATRLCNLRCSYCHDWRVGRDQTMAFPVLARLIARALSDPEHDSVDFIWHGGETTVLPLSFYEKALAVQARFQRPGQHVQNTFQTNGTRLSPEWVRFFKRNEVTLGISLDGPPELHDRYRRYASGRPSFADVARGLRLLQAAEMPFSVLMVIDEGGLALGPDRVFDFMLEYGIKQFACIAAKPDNQPHAAPGTPTGHYTDPGRFTAFLSRLFDRWLEHDDPTISIREINGVRRRVQGEGAGFCTLAGGCLGKYYLVEPNGDIAHCDLFLGDPAYTFGNILRDDFAAIRRDPRLQQLQVDNAAALSAMHQGCPEFGICNGWCPHERYLSARHNAAHSAECCGLRPLIGHIRERLRARGELVVEPTPRLPLLANYVPLPVAATRRVIPLAVSAATSAG